jgi:hypothetical protein
MEEQTMVTKSRPSAGLAIASVHLLGTFTVATAAEEHHDQRRGGEHRGDDRGHGRCLGGGHRAPPVVYGGLSDRATNGSSFATLATPTYAATDGDRTCRPQMRLR